MTSQLDAPAAHGSSAHWRDKKRYLWLMGLIAPTALFVVLPVIWGLNQLGWTTISQAFFWVGPVLIYVLLPSLDSSSAVTGRTRPTS